MPAHDDSPMGNYAILISVFGVTFAGSLRALQRSGRELPEHVGARDVMLMGIATQKVSRVLAKERVTSPLRAPFTRSEGRAGPGEVDEKPRGRGLQRTIGELLLCPFCLSQWIAGAFALGLVAAPRTTRLLAAMWTATSVADVAQVAYARWLQPPAG